MAELHLCVRIHSKIIQQKQNVNLILTPICTLYVHLIHRPNLHCCKQEWQGLTDAFFWHVNIAIIAPIVYTTHQAWIILLLKKGSKINRLAISTVNILTGGATQKCNTRDQEVLWRLNSSFWKIHMQNFMVVGLQARDTTDHCGWRDDQVGGLYVGELWVEGWLGWGVVRGWVVSGGMTRLGGCTWVSCE